MNPPSPKATTGPNTETPKIIPENSISNPSVMRAVSDTRKRKIKDANYNATVYNFAHTSESTSDMKTLKETVDARR